MSDKNDEQVLTVSASRVRDLFGDSVWLPSDATDIHESDILDAIGCNQFSLRRGVCETDERFLQVIPYLILRYEDHFYAYTRGEAGGEDRLHAKTSIGIGGHIDDEDTHAELSVSIECGEARELDEEIDLGDSNRVDHWLFAGLIYDRSDPVGRVHLGVVIVLDLASSAVTLRDRALTDGRWVTLAELATDADRLGAEHHRAEHLAGKAVAK